MPCNWRNWCKMKWEKQLKNGRKDINDAVGGLGKGKRGEGFWRTGAVVMLCCRRFVRLDLSARLSSSSSFIHILKFPYLIGFSSGKFVFRKNHYKLTWAYPRSFFLAFSFCCHSTLPRTDLPWRDDRGSIVPEARWKNSDDRLSARNSFSPEATHYD